MGQPRGRREAERRARMEGSGSSTPKPQGTVKTRRTGTRRQAKEKARKSTQHPGQSQKNGLGRRHGKQKSWTPPRRRDRATTGRQPPRNRRDTNRHLTKKDKEAQLEGRRHQRQTPQPTRNSPQREEGWIREEQSEGERGGGERKGSETWSAGQKQAGSEPSTSRKAMNTPQDTRATRTKGDQTTYRKTTRRGLQS